MDDVTIARALHVVSVVLWIGGVGFVTTVLLPAVRHLKEPNERLEFFDWIERRFAREARFWTIVVGVTGFYMLARFDLWDRFSYPAYWWLDAMIAVWLLFTLMLFVVEPLFNVQTCSMAPPTSSADRLDHHFGDCGRQPWLAAVRVRRRLRSQY